MTTTTILVGMDVQKKTIAVATVEGPRISRCPGSPHYRQHAVDQARASVRRGRPVAEPEKARSAEGVPIAAEEMTKEGHRLHLCYEAGP